MLSEIDIKQRIIKGDIIISPLSEDSIRNFEIDITASCFAWLIPYSDDDKEPSIVFPLDNDDKLVDYTKWIDVEKSSNKQKQQEKKRIQGLLSELTNSRHDYRLCIPAKRTIVIVANEAIYLNNEVSGSGKHVMDLKDRGLMYGSSPVRANSANRLYVHLTNVLNKDIYIDVNENIMRIQLHDANTPIEKDVVRSVTNAESLLSDHSLPSFFRNTEFVLDFLKCEVNIMKTTMMQSSCYGKIKKEMEIQKKTTEKIVKMQEDERENHIRGIILNEFNGLNARIGRLERSQNSQVRRNKIMRNILIIASVLMTFIIVIMLINSFLQEYERIAFWQTAREFFMTARGILVILGTIVILPILIGIISNIITPKIESVLDKFRKKEKKGIDENKEDLK